MSPPTARVWRRPHAPSVWLTKEGKRVAGEIIQGSPNTSTGNPIGGTAETNAVRMKGDDRTLRIYAEKDGEIVGLREDAPHPFLIFFRVYGEDFIDLYVKVTEGLEDGTEVTCPFNQVVQSGTLAITSGTGIKPWNIFYAGGFWQTMEMTMPEL